MKLSLSRREFNLVASKMVVGTMAGGSLLAAGNAVAQPRKVNLGTFGSIDVQNYIRAQEHGREDLRARHRGRTS